MISLICLVFSKDRVVQLQAAIESFFLHNNHGVEMCVLYKATSLLHQRQYNRLRDKFPNVSFQEEYDFEVQVSAIVSQSEYVLFLVDDAMFVKDFSLIDIIARLQENKDAIGFSLRLGTNTNYCYPKDVGQKLPVFEEVGTGILKYDWTRAEYDFGYPLEICSSVYRTVDILPLLREQKYDNPNTLEGMLASNVNIFSQTKSQLLCYKHSVAFTNPVNIVQTVTTNRKGDNEEYSAEKLAQAFEAGFEIDVENYSGFVPNSCHQEVRLKLRTEKCGIQ